MYKDPLQLNNTEKINYKIGKNLHTDNNHMQNVSVLLEIRELKIKTTMRQDYTLTRMAIY